MPVDILKSYYDETDNTIKFSIRDTFQSHAGELKRLIEQSTKVSA